MVLFNPKYQNEAVSITYLFLKKIGLKIPLSAIKDFFNTHIYKDTLLCIQDFLSVAGLHTKTIKYNKADIEQTSQPFIAILTDNLNGHNKFAIISDISDDEVNMLDSTNYKWKRIKKPAFFKAWTKVALLVEDRRTDIVKIADFKTSRRGVKSMVQSLILTILAVLLVRYAVDYWLALSMTILNGAGIIISYILVRLSFGYKNPITSKFCNLNEKFDCTEIMESNGASIFKIKWAVIGLSYFIANSLISSGILLMSKEDSTLLLVFNCFPLLFFIYSILYQWLISKKWCLLCLSTQALLVIQVLLLFFSTKISFTSPVGYQSLTVFSIFIFIHLVTFYFINYMFLAKYVFFESNKIDLLSYKKALLKPNSFHYFSQLENTVEQYNGGLSIGNPNASNTITLITSPSCVFCTGAVIELLSLIKTNANVHVQIIFLCSPGEAESNKDLVVYFLHLFKIAPSMIADALCYWATSKPTLENLMLALPINGTRPDVTTEIKNMAEWGKSQNISSIPTLIVNGRVLPAIYAAKDLKFFLI